MQTKKGRIFLAFSILILLVSFISAIDTNIKIKTMPAQEVNVAIGEPNGEGNSWKFFKKTSDEYGVADFTAPINTDEFDLIITIKKDGELVKHPSFDNPYKSYENTAGEKIYLELYPSWFTPIESSPEAEEILENETIEDTEEIVENETITKDTNEEVVAEEKISENKELTGGLVAEEHAFSDKSFYYILGVVGILMIGFVSFIASKKVKRVKKEKGKEKLDSILDEMDSKGKPKKKKKDLVDDVKKKMKEIEDEMEELKDN